MDSSSRHEQSNQSKPASRNGKFSNPTILRCRANRQVPRVRTATDTFVLHRLEKADLGCSLDADRLSDGWKNSSFLVIPTGCNVERPRE